MTSISYISRLAVATVSFTIVIAILDAIGGAEADLESLPWLLLSNLLTVSILSYLVAYSRWAGIRLVLAVFLFYFGVSHFNNLVEAMFFQLEIPLEKATTMAIKGLVAAGILSALLVWLLGKMKSLGGAEPITYQKRNVLQWVWRIIVCDIIYVVLYFIAGAITYPFVQEFYSTRILPTISQLLQMQLFRGLLFVGLSLLIIRSMAAKRVQLVLSLGLALSIIGGIAPLLLPNPYMPPNIRLIHAVEVGISNFIFGTIIGFLLAPRVSKLLGNVA